MIKPAIVIVAAVALAGCQHTGSVGSVIKGECQLVRTPEYAVRGRATYDQAWINRTIEALVDGCRQGRPKARPASLDAKPLAAKAVPAKRLNPIKRWLGS